MWTQKAEHLLTRYSCLFSLAVSFPSAPSLGSPNPLLCSFLFCMRCRMSEALLINLWLIRQQMSVSWAHHQLCYSSALGTNLSWVLDHCNTDTLPPALPLSLFSFPSIFLPPFLSLPSFLPFCNKHPLKRYNKLGLWKGTNERSAYLRGVYVLTGESLRGRQELVESSELCKGGREKGKRRNDSCVWGHHVLSQSTPHPYSL